MVDGAPLSAAATAVACMIRRRSRTAGQHSRHSSDVDTMRERRA
jgi:hypothetical protein